jgi:predicted DNA-binding WGR domain protein
MTEIEFLSLRWEHPEKRRYYKLMLSHDLLGDWVITKVWGGIGKAGGRIMHLPCFSYIEAQKLVEDITVTRGKRGYLLCHL